MANRLYLKSGCESAGTNELREPPSHESCRPPRLSGHGRRGALHVPRMAGMWGAGVAMVVASGVLGPVALIHRTSLQTEPRLDGHMWAVAPGTLPVWRVCGVPERP